MVKTYTTIALNRGEYIFCFVFFPCSHQDRRHSPLESSLDDCGRVRVDCVCHINTKFPFSLTWMDSHLVEMEELGVWIQYKQWHVTSSYAYTLNCDYYKGRLILLSSSYWNYCLLNVSSSSQNRRPWSAATRGMKTKESDETIMIQWIQIRTWQGPS